MKDPQQMTIMQCIEMKKNPEYLKDQIRKSISSAFDRTTTLDDRVDLLNTIRSILKEYSPFKDEPVDCVFWAKQETVIANDYNPNSVAPPEMKLLEHSIAEDGYTQPIVAWSRDKVFEVVDGFHRNRVGKECESIRDRVHGYLPLAIINKARTDKSDRIASTIRHNRARGKHQVDSMSEIVIELKNRNWTNQRISKELGMDEDEILRLCQITGLSELFKDEDFSRAWDLEDSEADFESLGDEIDESDKDQYGFYTVNTSDEKRIFHTYDKWECFKAGFYNTSMEGMSKDQCESAYRDFLADDTRFRDALAHVTSEWKNSCEHYLTNQGMNRIAWLGQAAMCYATGIPSTFRGGYNLLTQEQQDIANNTALEYLNEWLKKNGRDPVTLEEAITDKQSDLY